MWWGWWCEADPGLEDGGMTLGTVGARGVDLPLAGGDTLPRLFPVITPVPPLLNV